MKSRTHEITVTVRFDKPTTRRHAVAEFRDVVHGEFYPYAPNATDPETMRITSVRSASRTPRTK